ncbi:MAG: hypothetical protein R3F20_18745 [Planctomycetota bacterium]
MSEQTDIIGRPIDGTEAEILALYRRLKAMSGRDDLAPCVTMNLREAAASLWQIVVDLDLDWEHPYDQGI